MERKIGEIFEYKGEWYQCVEGTCNNECYFYNRSLHKTIAGINGNGFGACNACFRNDNKSVIFKKLEKVGEPYGFQKRTFQTYKLHTILFLSEDVELVAIPSKDNNTIEIEIKQNKEDMEEKKVPLPKEDNYLTRIVYDYVNGKILDKEFIKSIKEMSDEYPYDKNSLKPFSLEAAKLGKPVCTRDGRKARIICFDLKNGEYPIVAAIGNDSSETLLNYTINGEIVKGNYKSGKDLMMLPEKKEGWVNVYNLDNIYSTGRVYFSKEEAEKRKDINCVATIKIEWEE